MAEHLGCQEQAQSVSEWLLNAAKSVSQHNEESSGQASVALRSAADNLGGEPPAKRQCNRFTTAQYWHYTRVCAGK